MIGRKFIVLLFLVLAGMGWYASRPCLVIYTQEKIFESIELEKGMAVSTRFIHSVQKTPVEEYFTVSDAGDCFVLHSTKYQSFGVGLPFMASDGKFRREGDWFVMDEMERNIPVLTLRPGVGTELTLTIKNMVFPLYEMVPLGTSVTLRIVPRYKIWSGLEG